MGGHLRADLAKIKQASVSMETLGDEFANITHVADVGGAAGNAALASALSDFAGDWSDKRNQLIGQLKELATMADKAVQEYTSTDNTLASKLAAAGKPSAGGHG